MAKKPSLVYQIKVTLDDTHPPIWRRILVPGNTSLFKLHDILQLVMGWEDYHLHYFLVSDQYYGNPEDDEYGDFGTINEKYVQLKKVILGEGFKFKYEYDFGDSWMHTLLVEKILPPEEGVHYPVCMKGKRACPPEDVGGVGGYENFLEAIRDPEHPEHEEYLQWGGEDFDPEAFDVEEVNQQLRSMGKSRLAERDNYWGVEDEILTQKKLAADSPWVQSLPPDQRSVAEALSLRLDTVTLLTYLDEYKPSGTQSTGNFQLKAVREITSRFVSPPVLDVPVGDQIYPLRSEIDVWPLYFIHVLVSVGGLVEGGPGRRWKLTPLGEQFLKAPSPVQVWHLFYTWWAKTNWQIAFPYELGGWSYSESRFARLVLDSLLSLAVGEATPFDMYADLLIERSTLTWPHPDQTYARKGLRNAFEAMVIDPLVNFGVLEAEYTPVGDFGLKYHDLQTFKVTEFGRGILEAMA